MKSPLCSLVSFQVVLASSKANIKSDEMVVSLATTVSLNSVTRLKPGERVWPYLLPSFVLGGVHTFKA